MGAGQARAPKVVDLDANDAADTMVLVTIDGVRVALTRNRVIDLFRHEAKFFAMLTNGAPAPAGPVTAPASIAAPALPPEQEAEQLLALKNQVSHASLSSRIKKVYNYSVATR